MTPRQVVEEWVRRFNAADADAIAELYRDDATNHQVVQEPVVGKAAIREMFRREFATAKMTCIDWRWRDVRQSATRWTERVLQPRSRPLLWRAKPALLVQHQLADDDETQ